MLTHQLRVFFVELYIPLDNLESCSPVTVNIRLFLHSLRLLVLHVVFSRPKTYKPLILVPGILKPVFKNFRSAVVV